MPEVMPMTIYAGVNEQTPNVLASFTIPIPAMHRGGEMDTALPGWRRHLAVALARAAWHVATDRP